MPATFQPINDDKPFTQINQDVVDLLESFTPAEKAQAVPHVRIWQVDRTGRPIHGDALNRPTAPLSLQFVEPPRFGASIMDGNSRFRERPPVSLERVSVKWQNPNGIILYRVLHFTFMVHRPDVIFGEPDPSVDSFVAMIIPGSLFVLEYGWKAGSGVKNGLLNGDGYEDEHGIVRVQGRLRIRFIVTNYSFKILPDNQISIEVDAYEDGEFNIRQSLGIAIPPSTADIVSGQKNPIEEAKDPFRQSFGTGFLAKLQEKVRGKPNKDKQKGQNGIPDQVSFQDVADTLFAPVIADAYTRLGYRNIALVMGNLNDRVGIPSAQYRFQATGDDLSIGDFYMPMREVENVYNGVMRSGQQLTLYNFLVPFLRVFNSPETWDRSKAAVEPDGVTQNQTLPEVAIKTITNGDSVTFYIVDLKHEHSRFASSDQLPPEKLVGGKVTRNAIKEKCRKAGVPVISFQKGNSFIQDSSFGVIADEQIKSLFIRRYLNRVRKDIVSSPSITAKQGTGLDPRQVLYSSAISGDITMLGNFAFDVFSLVWLDFGVVRWDGPFRVQEREDLIEAGSFVTRVHLVSEGSDPLGTQGRLDQKPTGGSVAGTSVDPNFLAGSGNPGSTPVF